MAVTERLQKSFACDNPRCTHSEESKGTFCILMDQKIAVGPQGQPQMVWEPDPSVTVPDWAKNLRAVLVDDGTAQGTRKVYCSGACESKCALEGMHDPISSKKIDTESKMDDVIKGAAAAKQMQNPTQKGPKLQIARR